MAELECRKAISLIHDYFDGDLGTEGKRQLREHLQLCESCRKRFYQLEKTEALIRSLPAVPVSEEIGERIMANLPKPKRSWMWIAWAKRHPALAAVIVFLLILFGSVFSLVDHGGKQLVVRVSDQQDHLIIEGDTVIVPKGKVIRGNLIVENGKIQIDGEVEGNLVVIDGTVQLASTAKISGEVTRINQTIDRLWFKAGEWFSRWTSPSSSQAPSR